jgi:hypothetical protein
MALNNVAELRLGEKVHYKPSHFTETQWENGIIKEIREDTLDSVWVVYNCAGQWKRYTEYTSAKTNLRDLHVGWRFT